MFLNNIYPTEYFNNWFIEPIIPVNYSVLGIIKTLNEHSLSADKTAQNYIMPLRRCREKAGKFRIFGENQDNYYCFVYAGEEEQQDPPVYFETCLDLKIDCGFDETDIIDGTHVLVCSHFINFLWYILGCHVCIRLESENQFKPEVNGIVFASEIELGSEFINPMIQEFPAGFTSYISYETICIPEWGAAFLNQKARQLFLKRYQPKIRSSWH